MNLGNFTSYSEEGDQFLLGMIGHHNRRQQSQSMFTEFVESIGIKHWHIHDGWVTDMKHQTGSVLDNDKIMLTWIFAHRGYSHSFGWPHAGDLIAIIDRSPDISNPLQFDLNIFEVTEVCGWNQNRFVLTKKEVRRCYFNHDMNKYELLSEAIYRKPEQVKQTYLIDYFPLLKRLIER